jgi:hypothetical protein
LVLVSSAFAGSGATSVEAYGSTPAKVAGAISQSSPAASSGDLPFTGQNLAIVAIAGVVLVGTGFALRGRGRKSSS